ncbi:MAG TPA: hypothetical protein PLG90_01000 [Ignavibacteria bacterium]|nr:hypothetical protein [Ignavibacteria bacterium]
MRIKKFICYNCGAPKINEYKSPYVVCDYCGSLMDIDYTIGMDVWNISGSRTLKYQKGKYKFENKLQQLLSQGKQTEYQNLQIEYWDYYYKVFPEYLPPSVSNEAKYKVYLDIAADSSTDATFNKSWEAENKKLNEFQSKLKYTVAEGKSVVTGESFFPMAEFYIAYLKKSFKGFYSDERYKLLNEFLPEQIHLKMKLSSFVQIWIPYLIEKDADKFLELAGFKQQFIEIEKPPGKEQDCYFCKTNLFIPEGSYQVYCENCMKLNAVSSTFKCKSCGGENSVPENPAKPIDCVFCGTENKLIRPLFG